MGRWAGITIYEPATAVNSDEKSEHTKFSQEIKAIKEESMSILTIDTKKNCYVIDPAQMNNLQQDVANYFTLEQGTFDIKIAGGRYSRANSQTEGEPFVLLWIYGIDGNIIINKATDFEVSKTWTTLNGYDDKLKLEVKETAVLCALFFDVNHDSSGEVELSITSNNPSFIPHTLIVDSKRNCYLLDETYLSSLKQAGANFIELNTGKYRIKIRNDSSPSYWSDNKKFELEPWALIWVKDGKFITKLTGIEVEETWFSLNGLKDEVVLEVKEKTTLSGLFFDTHNENKEGQIILAIEPVSTTELIETANKQEDNNAKEKKQVQTETKSVSTEVHSTFRFDQAQMEQTWQQMAPKIETSVTDKQDARNPIIWDQLENLMLKGYQTQVNNLVVQVARVEFMMKALTQQMEGSFNQNFQVWSGHFDNRLNELINTRIGTVVEEQVNLKIANQTQEIKNLVLQQMQTDIDHRIDSVVNLKVANQSQEIKNVVLQQMQTDIDHRIDSVVNLKFANQSQEINNQVIQQIQTDMDQRINTVVNLKFANQTQEINNQVVQQIQTDMDQRIDTVVNLKVTNQSQEINNQVVQQIQTDMDQRIDSVVSLKIANQTQNIKNLVIQQIQTDIDQRIDTVVNLKVTNQSQEINNQVVQQIQTDIDQRIDSVVNLKIANQTQNIKNLVIQQMQSDIDQRINSVVDQSTNNNVKVVVNNVISDLDNRINANFDNKILNFRNDVSSLVRNEITQNFTESTKATILSEIKKQQFFLDLQSIKAEVENFYMRLGQFETQLYSRINQGDAQLYSWTLEQLVALQSCLTDRQALIELFESFSARLKTDLDNAPCVNTSRFTPWAGIGVQPQLSPVQPQQLPGS